MFTCCPECATVFRVTANQLRIARGDVRCGNCAHVFNAMESLADEVPAVTMPPEPAAPGVPTTAATDESEDLAHDPLEFDAPEQAWSEIFISAGSGGDVALDGELEAITADPEEWRAMLAELGMEPDDVAPAADEDLGFDVAATSLLAESEAAAYAAVESPEPATGEAGPEAVYVIDDQPPVAAEDSAAPAATGPTTKQATAQPPTGTRSAPTAATSVAEPEDEELPPWSGIQPDAEAQRTRPRYVGWAGALLLALSLAAQIGHHYRDRLATHPRYGGLVRELYARLHQPLYPEWPLDAFHIRRSEALAGGTAPNALDISAAVDVSGGQPVGLPLLRVTLRDQWSNTVGSRVFVPREYLAAALPELVPPGTRIPVALSLADPGPDARGYEVDLCLQRRWRGLECQLAEQPYRP